MFYTFLIYGIFFFLFGLIIGSFLNVVIYRYNTGRSVQGRSGCLSCGKTLSAVELIPLFSFIFQKGKCHGCGSKISWQYPLVEFSTGIAFTLIAFKYFDLLFISPIYFALLFVILATVF